MNVVVSHEFLDSEADVVKAAARNLGTTARVSKMHHEYCLQFSQHVFFHREENLHLAVTQAITCFVAILEDHRRGVENQSKSMNCMC